MEAPAPTRVSSSAAGELVPLDPQSAGHGGETAPCRHWGVGHGSPVDTASLGPHGPAAFLLPRCHLLIPSLSGGFTRKEDGPFLLSAGWEGQ